MNILNTIYNSLFQRFTKAFPFTYMICLCLLFRLYYNCPVVATGGKGNLHGPYDNLALYPDLDAVEEWRKPGADIREWWKDMPDCLGKSADIGDLIDFFCRKRKNAYICQK